MNTTAEIISKRCSCNKYKAEHVPPEDIRQMLAAALNAPSGMNRKTPRFVVVQNAELVKKLSEMNARVMGRDVDPFYGAPDVIIVLAKKEGTYINDGSLAMGNLLNAAFAMGYGCRWINRAREIFETADGKALLAQWGIVEDVEGIAFCILGYPDTELTPAPSVDGRVYYVD